VAGVVKVSVDVGDGRRMLKVAGEKTAVTPLGNPDVDGVQVVILPPPPLAVARVTRKFTVPDVPYVALPV